MIKYLPLLFLMACNSEAHKEMPPVGSNISDSLFTAIDSLKLGLHDLSLVSDYAKDAQVKIDKLNKEKHVLQNQLDNEVRIVTVEKKDASKDKLIAELRNKLAAKENEIASLKRKSDTPVYKDAVGFVAIETEVKKPDEKSIVISLDRGLRNGGEVALNNVDIYLIPYSKRVEKRFKVYEVSCDLSYINSLDSRKALIYQGEYFFNDVQPGKYIIKICSYYGGYSVVRKNGSRQTVSMKVSNTQ